MHNNFFSKLIATSIVFSVLFINTASGQIDSLKREIMRISEEAKGIVGVGIMDLQSKEVILLHEDHQFPMQSVYKFPLGMAVMNQVDKGQLSLAQKVHVAKEDLNPKTWSPLQKKHPEGNIDITIEELLSYTISQSDNNACDILFRLVGGPAKVDEYVKGLGVKEISIVATEEEMSKDWNVQYTNWSRPSGMLKLLDVFHSSEKLSGISTDFLLKTLIETSTGPNKMKGLLPKDAVVAHKTGMSSRNDKGILAATNDVGIMKLPDGKQIAVVVYVSETPLDDKASDVVIAKITKAAWDYYSAK
ncbi:MAG TPA: class A beta-lactamase, subclass A2 [Dyadobacter sp.]|jgi:beta-lactamase class A|nr:class A beta-lactamase, subclass A2 [Dyadobacter sp.]